MPELRGRLADVLFVVRRHHKFGKAAIDAYLESAAKLLTPNDWVKASYRLERALMITVSVKAERDRVVNIFTEKLNKRAGDPSYFSAKMMEVLLEQRFGDAALMAPLAEAAAEAATTDGEWDRAREYFLLLAQWSRRGGNAPQHALARRQAAESYVKLADGAGAKSLEASFLERAIQSLPPSQAPKLAVRSWSNDLCLLRKKHRRSSKSTRSPYPSGMRPIGFEPTSPASRFKKQYFGSRASGGRKRSPRFATPS